MLVQPTPTEIDAVIKSKGRSAIVSRECKHATYAIGQSGEHDALVVKEWITFNDGSRLPTIKRFEDYKRPYWVNKPECRDHDEKIQYENIIRTNKFSCRQLDLSRELCNHLHFGAPNWGVKRLARKPYVYGCDFGPEVYLKQSYMTKYPNSFKPNLVTVVDCETDMSREGYRPILWSEVNENEIIVYYSRRWCGDHLYYEEDVRKAYDDFIGPYLDQMRKELEVKGKYPEWIDHLQTLPLRFVAGEDEVEITKSCIDHLHYTQPDIVTGWNVFFDVGCMHDTAVLSGSTPDNWLSDPRIPYEFKLAYIEEGPTHRLSAAGVSTHLAPQERWHIMLHTASFRFSDAMQVYWNLRKAKGKENGGYGLDGVLTRQLGVGKVKAEISDSSIPPNTSHWHFEMQREYKVAYGLYNIVDSLGLRALEYKNNDLTSQMSTLAGATDYSKFSSQPTINAADMHFYAIANRGKVLCTTSDEMESELDASLFERQGWMKINVFSQQTLCC